MLATPYPFLLTVIGLLLWRIGAFKVRLIRSGAITFTFWFILHNAGYSLIEYDPQLDELMILYPYIAFGFYYALHTIAIGLCFEAIYLIDKNAVGVLFKKRRGVVKTRRREHYAFVPKFNDHPFSG